MVNGAAGKRLTTSKGPPRPRTAESPTWLVLKRLFRNPKGAIGTAVLAMLILMAALAPVLAP